MGGAEKRGATGGTEELLETSAGPVFVYTRDGELVDANEGPASLLGVDSPSELLSTHAGDFTHPDHEELVADRHERLRAGEPVPPTTEKLVDAQGNLRHALLASTPSGTTDSPRSKLSRWTSPS